MCDCVEGRVALVGMVVVVMGVAGAAAANSFAASKHHEASGES